MVLCARIKPVTIILKHLKLSIVGMARLYWRPGDSDQKPAHRICLKFESPAVRMMLHLSMLFFELRIQRISRRKHKPKSLIAVLESVLYYGLFQQFLVVCKSVKE